MVWIFSLLKTSPRELGKERKDRQRDAGGGSEGAESGTPGLCLL